MAAYAKVLKVAPAEYLEVERSSETKHEFYDGAIVAMAGSTVEHDFVTVDIVTSLNTQLLCNQCKVFSGNMRVYVPDCNCYFYPDASVVCPEPLFQRIDGVQSLTNPTLIVEVLWESTAKVDREHKFFCYQTLPSLQTYVLAAQDEPLVQVFEKQPNDKWEYSHFQGLDATVPLAATDCILNLADVYARVEFRADGATAAMRILEQQARYNERSAPGGADG